MRFGFGILAALFYFCLIQVNASDVLTQKNEYEREPKEIAVVQLSFDGINTFHCGVGTVVQQTQAVIKEFNRQNENVRFKLYLLSGGYSSELPEYSSETLHKNIVDCKETGGEVYLIPIKIKDQMFGEPGQWQELCKGGAEQCLKIINENANTILIAHDTAFAQLPMQLSKLADEGKVLKPYQAIWVPHATSWSYNGHSEDGTANWPERHQWELEAFQNAEKCNYKIGFISPSILQQITSNPFNLNESSLISYRTGILLDKYLNSMSIAHVEEELKKHSIPLNKRIIFSVGRANPLKGLDITLEVYRHLKEIYSDIHLVLLAPPSDFMPSYLSMLKTRIKNESLDVTLIDKFNPELAHYIYQWPNTVMISLLSRMDTQPLTVMEARVNPKNSIILVSDPDRMGKQVTDGINGFVCSLRNLEETIENPSPLNESLELIVNKARRILDLPNHERIKIIEEGKVMIRGNYDLRVNMKKNFDDFFKQEAGKF